MPSTRRVQMPWTTIYAKTTTGVFMPVTTFMEAPSIDRVRGTFELRALLGDLTAALAYQTCNTDSSLDSAVALGSWATAEGFTYPTAVTDISSATDGKQLIRFGWLVKNTSTSNQTMATVAGTIEIIVR